MTDARMKSFFDKMVAPAWSRAIDYKKAYTLQFVNKGVGVDLRQMTDAREAMHARVSDSAVLARLAAAAAADPIRRGRSGC
jgi:hypothetical protein